MWAWNRPPGSSVPDNKTRQPQISKIWPEKTTFEVQTNHFLAVPENYFSAEFRSIPFRASEWALPRNSEFRRNEFFFPRNNGIRSEAIPRNFFGTKFRCQPYTVVLCTVKGYPVCSMNKTGGRRKLFTTNATAESWGSRGSAPSQAPVLGEKPFITTDTGAQTNPFMSQYDSLTGSRALIWFLWFIPGLRTTPPSPSVKESRSRIGCWWRRTGFSGTR